MLPAALFTASTSHSCTVLANTSFLESGFKDIQNTTDASVCCAACFADTRCGAWTIDDAQQVCHLKSLDYGQKSTGVNGVSSAVVRVGKRSELLRVGGPPAVVCTHNLNCSLNGVCVDAKCVCDAPWFSDRVDWQCATIFTAKAQPGGMYGYSPNVTSWGGNALKSEVDGLYHLFAAEIPGGLTKWASKSQCVHATATTPSGPFTRHDYVLTAECHNPATIRDVTTGEYYLSIVCMTEFSPNFVIIILYKFQVSG